MNAAIALYLPPEPDRIVCPMPGLQAKSAQDREQTDLKFIDGDDPKQAYFLTNDDYEKLPLPSRELIDLHSYHYSIDKKSKRNGCYITQPVPMLVVFLQ